MPVNKELVRKKLQELDNPLLNELVETALEVGDWLYDQEPSGAEYKREEIFGDKQTPLVLRQDKQAQHKIITRLHKALPDAFFLAEEDTDDAHLLSSNFLDHTKDLVIGADPIDGTNQFFNKLSCWCVAIGAAQNLKPKASVIYSPVFRGGMIFFGDHDKAFWSERDELQQARVGNTELKQALIKFGGDTMLIQKARDNFGKLRPDFRIDYSAPSGEMALGLIASGRVDAVVQAEQGVWDWFAGYPLVKNAGGKVVFINHESGKPELFDEPLPKHFDPTDRKVGLIAGAPHVVDWLIENKVYEGWTFRN